MLKLYVIIKTIIETSLHRLYICIPVQPPALTYSVVVAVYPTFPAAGRDGVVVLPPPLYLGDGSPGGGASQPDMVALSHDQRAGVALSGRSWGQGCVQ